MVDDDVGTPSLEAVVEHLRKVLKSRRLFGVLRDARVANALSTLNKLAADAETAGEIPQHRVQLFDAVARELIVLLAREYDIEGLADLEDELLGSFDPRVTSLASAS